MIDPKQKLLLEYITSDTTLFIKVVGVINPEYFELPLRPTVDFVLKYFRDYHATPTKDILLAQTGIDFETRPVTEDQRQYFTQEIEKFAQEQAMKNAFVDSVPDLEKGDMAPIFNRVREALRVSIDKNLGTDLMENPIARLLTMQQNIEERSIGYKALDELLGMVRRGELILFAGGPGTGKSLTLSNIGDMLNRSGLDVLYITLELAENLVAKRLDGMVANIAQKAIFDNVDEVASVYEKERATRGRFVVKRMPSGTKPAQIQAYLMEYMLQYGKAPDVFILDYLDIAAPDQMITNGGVFDKDKAVTEQVREIVLEHDMYGFTASQLNRESFDAATVTSAHIAGGISKVNTADAVVALLRRENNVDRGEIEFQPVKLRNTEMSFKPVFLYVDPKTLKYHDKPITKNAGAAVAEAANKAKTKETPKQSPNDRLKDLIGKSKRINA